MVSVGPNTQATIMTRNEMCNFPNFSNCTPCQTVKAPYSCNSIMSYIDKDPRLSNFKDLVLKAKMDSMLNDDQGDFTVFVPIDCGCADINPYIPREFVQNHMLNRRIPIKLLGDSPASFFINFNKKKLLVTNVAGDLRINNSIQVFYGDIICRNGIIHLISRYIS